MFFSPLKVVFFVVVFVSGTASLLSPLATVIQSILSIFTIHSSNVQFVTDSDTPSSFCSVGWLTSPNKPFCYQSLQRLTNFKVEASRVTIRGTILQLARYAM